MLYPNIPTPGALALRTGLDSPKDMLSPDTDLTRVSQKGLKRVISSWVGTHGSIRLGSWIDHLSSTPRGLGQEVMRRR